MLGRQGEVGKRLNAGARELCLVQQKLVHLAAKLCFERGTSFVELVDDSRAAFLARDVRLVCDPRCVTDPHSLRDRHPLHNIWHHRHILYAILSCLLEGRGAECLLGRLRACKGFSFAQLVKSAARHAELHKRHRHAPERSARGKQGVDITHLWLAEVGRDVD